MLGPASPSLVNNNVLKLARWLQYRDVKDEFEPKVHEGLAALARNGVIPPAAAFDTFALYVHAYPNIDLPEGVDDLLSRFNISVEKE
jgi:hypothetical protein